MKVALVTGASRGLGRAVALDRAGRGTHVIAVARTVGALEELDDEIRARGGRATLVPLDLTDDAGIARLAAAIHDRWGALDAWLHFAAQAPSLGPVAHADPAEADRVMAVNVRATLLMLRALDPLLRAAPAGLAVLADDPREGLPFFGAYAASKAAARALWCAWASETARAPLRVLRAIPPAMPTALRARFYPGEDRDALAPPAEVAAALHGLLDSGADPGAPLDLAAALHRARRRATA